MKKLIINPGHSMAYILLFICIVIAIPQNISGQTVLNNNNLLFGTGNENSVNTFGNLQQPFYYNNTMSLWRKLTYSSYPLDNSFAIGGVGTSEWNLNGTIVENPSMVGQVIDLSGYITLTSPNGYGTIISKGTITISSSNLEITNKYELGEGQSYIKVTTNVKNISGASVGNVRFWIGTRDDYVGGTDAPKKEKGNLVDGAFAKITNLADRALALRISTAEEGVLFYTNSSKGNNIINSCCSWTNVTNQNPLTSTIEITNDGSYGFFVRLNDLANGSSDEFTWYYAAGKLADLETIIAEVAAASGAISDITYSTATFKAKTSVSGTGYWIVVARNASVPTAAEIKSGTSYGAVTVVASGSGAMTANVEKSFYLTSLTAGTNYDLFFVSEDVTPAFSTIAKVQFTSQAFTIPVLTTNATVTDITTISAGSGGNVTNDGGTSVASRGVCWNTTGTPTIANSKTSDGVGSGSFSSSITGLSAGTTYYIRAYATNSAGTGYGNSVSFTTFMNSQTITFNAISPQTYGDADFAPGAIASSGLTVTYLSSNTDVATIVGNNIHLTGAGSTTITARQFGNASYAAAPDMTQPLVVGTKNLTVSGISVNSKEYDGSTTATLSTTGYSFSGVVGLDVVTLNTSSITANYDTKNIGSGKPVTIIGLTLGGSKATSYTLTQPTLTGNISVKPINVTALAKTKVYGDSDPALTYTFTPALITGDSFTGTLSRTAGENVGAFAINQNDLALSSNYTLSYTTADLSVTAKPIAVTAEAKTKVYGDSDPALTYTFTPALISGDSFTGELSRVSGENAGSFAINQNTLVLSSNYTLGYTSADLSITAKPVAVTAEAKTKVYGDSDPALTYTFTPALVTGDSFTGALSRIPGENVGTFAINRNDLALSTNYTLTFTSADLSITAKQIEVTADAKTKVYGDADPALTYTFTPALVTGDSFTGALSRTAGENVGTFAINKNDLVLSSNYTLSYTSDDLSITAKPVAVAAEAKTKVYGDSDPALTYIFTPALISGDAFSGALSRTTGENIGTFAINQNDLALSSNYTLNYTSADLSITAKPISVIANASQSKVYGNTDPVLTYSVSPALVSGDEFTGSLSRTEGENVGTGYAIALGTLTPGTNYTITFTSDYFAITPNPITVTANASQSKIYGSIDQVFTYAVAPALVTGDVFTGALSRVEGINTGSYAIQEGTLSAGSNYTITYVSANFTISKAPLSATADPKERRYLEQNPAFTISYSGFVSGENVSVLDVLPSAATTATANSDAGTYDITVAGGSDNNYTYTYNKGILIVLKADQVISFTDIPAGLRTTIQHQLVATSTSGLTVSFESSDYIIASISGSTLSVNKEGTVNITATQVGNNNWNPAPSVTITIATLPTFDNLRSLFTPNNDGMNDTWYIPDIEQYGQISVKIYNRYGKLVYESSAYKNDWDGTFNGGQLPSASYYYIIKSSEKGIIKGVVNLVR